MRTSLTERIRGDFEARILSGDLSPGDRLPTEGELQALYGCSRMTVNKALSALAAAGLVERRRRAGTLVARPRVHSMVLDIPDLAAEVAGRGQTYRYVQGARRLRTNPLGPMLEIDGVHEADGVPLAAEHRLVRIDMAPGIEDADFSASSPGSWLLRHVPWTEAETRIGAIAANVAQAHALRLRSGAACLAIRRRTWRGANPVTIVEQLFPADAYDVVARFGSAGAP